MQAAVLLFLLKIQKLELGFPQCTEAVGVLPLPIAGFTRTITLISRERELGTIPRVLAAELRSVLQATIREKVAPLLPGGVDPSVYGEPGDP